MWAQLMRWRLKPGKDTAGLREQLQAVEQPDSGLLRTMIMQDQKNLGLVSLDPSGRPLPCRRTGSSPEGVRPRR